MTEKDIGLIVSAIAEIERFLKRNNNEKRSGIIELLDNCNIDIPIEIKKKIRSCNYLRNKVVHDGYHASSDEIKQFMENYTIIKSYIEKMPYRCKERSENNQTTEPKTHESMSNVEAMVKVAGAVVIAGVWIYNKIQDFRHRL